MSTAKINIKEIRLNRGLSVDDVVEKLGIPRTTYGRIENGDVVPRPPNAKAIADWIGVRVTDIWPIDKTESGRS